MQNSEALSLAVNDAFQVLPSPGLLLLSDNGTQKNLITIGWLQFGNLWGKWTVNVFIRQSRHSFQLLQSSNQFSLNIMDPEKYRSQINYCASVSGREHCKIQESGLTPVITPETQITSLAEAKTVFECRILYKTLLEETDLSQTLIEKFYKNRDFHQLITAEILNIKRTEQTNEERSGRN